MSIGRRLAGAPVLLQDWDQDAEERGARYWELFLDLLLVATATSVADVLKEDQTPSGLAEFAVLYLAFINAWWLYTHHITARFDDPSLLHSFILLFFLLGTAYGIVNAGYETARAFSIGMMMQRVTVMLMLSCIGLHLPRARELCDKLSLWTGFGTIFFALSTWKSEWASWCWWVAAAIETSTELFMVFILSGRRLVPINIEHSKDRMGVLILVMLGETVISATITYRNMMREGELEQSAQYYIVLSLCILLIFMFTLLFFHMQPSPRDHAFRRSRVHGVALIIATKFLGLILLAMGVSVKLTVEAVAEKEHLSLFASRLMGLSVGLALLTLFFMRILHYGGKLPRPNDPPNVRRLMIIWWWTFGLASLLPFLAVGLGLKDPVTGMGTYAGLIFALCVIETCYTHILEEHLPTGGEEEEKEDEEGNGGEEEPLQHSIQPSYDT